MNAKGPKVQVSPLNTHLREMQAAAFKRATAEKQRAKIQRQMEQNHLQGGNEWKNGYTN
jgi:hypothetical protein